MDLQECCKKIGEYLNNLTNRLSSDEIEHLRNLEGEFSKKSVKELVKIIVTVEENRVPFGQDLGCLTLELINLLPPRHHETFYKLAKQQRIAILRKD